MNNWERAFFYFMAGASFSGMLTLYMPTGTWQELARIVLTAYCVVFTLAVINKASR